MCNSGGSTASDYSGRQPLMTAAVEPTAYDCSGTTTVDDYSGKLTAYPHDYSGKLTAYVDDYSGKLTASVSFF